MKTMFLLLALVTIAHASPFLKIEAGAHDRLQTPVTISLPRGMSENPALKSATGEILAGQPVGDGTAIFILPKLAAGESARYEYLSRPKAGDPEILAKDDKGDISFTRNGRVIAAFVGKMVKAQPEGVPDIYSRGGYLHPLFTPSGVAVTDDYPANHLHHHGVWTAWTNTVFQGRKTDFWNMGKGKGTVRCEGVDIVWSGQVFAGAEAGNEFIDLTSGTAITVLKERVNVKVFNIPTGKNPYHLLELISVQKTAGEDYLDLPEYLYGGLGIRGLEEWNGAAKASFLTSEGIISRDEANAKPARWIAMTGLTGKGVGIASIAILGHPKNFRAPQPIRVHPTEPFISFAPQITGDMKISHGENYRSAYRFVIFDGAPDKKLLDRLWNDYANPPKASWE